VTKPRDTLLAAKAVQYNADLLLSRILLTGLMFDVFDNPLTG